MEHQEGTFRGHGQTELHCQSWASGNVSHAAIAIVHGFGEHSGCYANLVDFLVARGYACFGFDHRGHGHSPGKRGHILSWDEYRGDVRAFLESIRERQAGSPLFLFGHSMGGLIALEYVLHDAEHLRGVIASAPILGEIGISPLLQLMGRIMSGLWPSFSLDVKLERQALSRNPDMVQASQEDPLCHSIGSARLGTEIRRARAWVHEQAGDLSIPLLILQGSADRITPPEGTRRFYEKVPPGGKTYLEYEGGYHELHNDITHEQVLLDLGNWLDRLR